ncbi:MAG: amidohydrolase family protein [Chitinophagaceae bacterium]|nr:amidohydrolase family protein [Chitinophagaceae bacterium]
MKNQSLAGSETREAVFYTMDDFPSVQKFDAHMHVNTNSALLVNFAKANNLGLLSINVDVPDFPSLEQQQEFTTGHLKNNPGHFAFIASFRVHDMEDPGWLEKTIAHLDDAFERGAVGVKVWKNIGMEYKDKDGNFVMIDDPRLDPVFDFIAQKNKTLLGHLGEPKNCWLPVEEMTVVNDKEYFSHHPEYHMYLHPEYPSYQKQIEARDHMLEKHPDMRFVGAHLASLEWSVDEIAERLERFPNLAVDMAERIPHLQYQAVNEYEKVRDFFIRYQDRILYATDITVDDSISPETVQANAYSTWINHWRFFISDEMMEAPEVSGKFRALHLPKDVVDKVYTSNFKKWYP